MRKNRKLISDKRLDREREEQDLKKNFECLKSMSSGLNPSPKAVVRILQPKVFRRETVQVPSLFTTSKFEPASPPKYEGELAEREKAARAEIERKKSRVGVLVNKSGYQYITDDTDLTTLGRK